MTDDPKPSEALDRLQAMSERLIKEQRNNAQALFEAGLMLGKAHKALAQIRQLCAPHLGHKNGWHAIINKIDRIAQEALDD